MRARHQHATPREASLAPAATTRPERNPGHAGRARSSATLHSSVNLRSNMKHRSAMAVAIALLLSLAGVVVPFGHPQAAAEAKDIPPTMLILDASGSMMARDADGQTRLDAAKEASKNFSRSVSKDSELGFMVYGTKVGNSPEEREAGCKDVTTLLPVGKGNAGKIPGEVDKVNASGHTPMGPALKQAAKELPNEGERSIVLVSDGEDTCAPPPVCDVAKDLHKQGIDLTINTVGFLVDPAARKELQCIAEAGGGEYLDAKDSESLAESMKVLATRTAQTAESNAPEIKGRDDAASATEVPEDVELFSTPLREKSGGAKNDEDGAEYFSTPIAEGERLAIGVATMPPPSQGSEIGFGKNFSVKVEVDEPLCYLANDNDVGIIDSNGPFFASWTTQQAGEDCPAGDFRFKVVRKSGPYKGKEIPAEVSIKRLPNEDLSEVPEPFAVDKVENRKEPSAAGKPRKVTPGAWFDNATELNPDAKETVSADIVPGEAHVYKIKTDYGQQLRGGIKVTSEPPRDHYAEIKQLDINVLNSARQKAAIAESVHVREGDSKAFGNPVRVNYRNMVGDGKEQPSDVESQKAWLDGEQYIVIFLNKSLKAGANRDISKEKNATATYELTTELVGEKIPGPSFEKVSNDTEIEESEKAEEPKETEQAAAEEDSSINWFLIGAGVLVVLAVALVALTRRGR
ncbi:VWA domain-containing protein [Corynebacterium sp. UMB9976]|uniref:vWA domain-containing protein n=1 Tax=Corynebacterium sp. UMB9976 TaxID=3046354 RepID=UPI002550221A|nr:VWA domain-containing protein [Corynebacterium sp. UMB9976]MDK6301906.1 VWA domain-containing protein [Corynebacterium sp. UMB9976]